jgi:hypothetical protein
MTYDELEDHQKWLRKVNYEESLESDTNIQNCLKCGRPYDSGSSGEYSFAANFCLCSRRFW